MVDRPSVDAAQVDRAVAEVVATSDVPGAVWGVAWGPPGARSVHVGATGLPRDALVRIASLTKPVAAVATVALVEREVLRLDDPVTRWLPELADRQVLRHPGAALDDTVAAEGEVTVHDLLTMGLGLGHDPRLDGSEPLAREVAARDLGPRHDTPDLDDESWLRAVGSLPMLHPPGAGWLYDTSYVALGILLSRATGTSLQHVLEATVLGPLAMTSTGRAVRPDDLARVPELVLGRTPRVESPAADPALLHEPRLQAASTELVSDLDDLLVFWQAVLDHDPRVLTPQSWRLVTGDRLSPRQRETSTLFLQEHEGWGYGGSVDLAPAYPGARTGRYGWAGGTGTFAAADREAQVAAVLLTQRGLDGPDAMRLADAFWGAVHA